jgi:hypothetical protein
MPRSSATMKTMLGRRVDGPDGSAGAKPAGMAAKSAGQIVKRVKTNIGLSRNMTLPRDRCPLHARDERYTTLARPIAVGHYTADACPTTTRLRRSARRTCRATDSFGVAQSPKALLAGHLAPLTSRRQPHRLHHKFPGSASCGRSAWPGPSRQARCPDQARLGCQYTRCVPRTVFSDSRRPG